MSGMTNRVVLPQAHYKDLREGFFLSFIDTPQLFHRLIRERVLDTVKLDKSNSIFVDVAFLSSSTELATQLSKKGLNVKFPDCGLVTKTYFLKLTLVPKAQVVNRILLDLLILWDFVHAVFLRCFVLSYLRKIEVECELLCEVSLSPSDGSSRGVWWGVVLLKKRRGLHDLYGQSQMLLINHHR